MKPLLALGLLATPAFAENPVVEDVTTTQTDGTWSFSVTLTHPDTGWDHYADGWRIETPDGTEMGFRELLHPHVNEQPFTRRLSGVGLPEGLETVQIRSRCLVDGWSEETTTVALER